MDPMIFQALAAAAYQPMRLVYEGTSGGFSITVPLTNYSKLSVVWGDGTVATYTDGSRPTKTYATQGPFTVQITGDALTFGYGTVLPGTEFLREVKAWGNLPLTNLSYGFYGATRLTTVPSSLPSTVTTLQSVFAGRGTSTTTLTGYGSWDVSNVTNTASMFVDCANLPGFDDITGWNVANVTNFSSMFRSTSFNQNIGSWNMSSAVTTSGMFSNTTAFNQDIGAWNVANVVNMNSMFDGAAAFNQDLSGWCVSNIASAPFNFDRDAIAWTLPSSRPVWGTCPT